jgi:predicted phage gp36 major capsid-like protein
MLFLSNNDCFIQPYASHELRKFKDYCVGILVQKIDKKTTALFDEMEKHFDNMWASSLTRDADLNEKASIELMKIQKMINEDKDDISDKVNKTTKLPN